MAVGDFPNRGFEMLERQGAETTAGAVRKIILEREGIATMLREMTFGSGRVL